MADIRETHVWFDGEHWHVYTERPADARRFGKLLGKPDPGYGPGPLGQKREVWWWRSRPKDSLRVGARRRVVISESEKSARRDRLSAHRAASARRVP